MPKALQVIITIVLTAVAFWGASLLVGNAVDRTYQSHCVVWKDCDQEAIRRFEAQGCEIVGTEDKKWAECDIYDQTN